MGSWVNGEQGLCVASADMYTPSSSKLRNRQCSCGRDAHDMLRSRVKCGGFERSEGSMNQGLRTLAQWRASQAINAVTGARLGFLSFLFPGTVLISYAAAATVVRLAVRRDGARGR